MMICGAETCTLTNQARSKLAVATSTKKENTYSSQHTWGENDKTIFWVSEKTKVLNVIGRNRRLQVMAHRTWTPSEELAKGNDREELHLSKLFRLVLL